MLPEDQCFWEVEYQDGTLHKEADGFKYSNIQRDSLIKFRLVYQGQKLFEITPPDWANGHNLVYRRRTSLSIGRSVNFVLGWMPYGPAFVVNISDGLYRVNPNGFEDGDPELYLPAPMPGEEFFTAHYEMRR